MSLTESSPLRDLAREHIAYIDPNEFASYIGRCKCGWQGRRRATRDDAVDDCAAHLIGIGVDLVAAPVVDEAKIAEVLPNLIFQYNQERITLKTFARAVVEALGGGR